MDTALRFATTCAQAYRRGGDRTRKLYNSAILDRVLVRDGHVTEAEYKEPFDVLFSEPKFEYDEWWTVGDTIRTGPHCRGSQRRPWMTGPGRSIGQRPPWTCSFS